MIRSGEASGKEYDWSFPASVVKSETNLLPDQACNGVPPFSVTVYRPGGTRRKTPWLVPSNGRLNVVAPSPRRDSGDQPDFASRPDRARMELFVPSKRILSGRVHVMP